MEYHEHQGQSLDRASNLSGTREDLPDGLRDNETGDGESSSKDEGEEEGDEDNASLKRSPLRSPERHSSVDDATKHHNTIQPRNDHHRTSDPSAFIDVPLEDGIDAKQQLHDVSDMMKRHLPLPVASEEDTSKATNDAEEERCNDLPLEDSTSASEHVRISAAPPLSSKGADTPPLEDLTSDSEHVCISTAPPLSSKGATTPPLEDLTSYSEHVRISTAPPLSSKGATTPPLEDLTSDSEHVHISTAPLLSSKEATTPPLEDLTSDSEQVRINTAPPLSSKAATTPPLEDSTSDSEHVRISAAPPLSSKAAATPQEILSTSDHITAGFANSFLLRSYLTPGPQMPIPHLPPHIAAAAAAAGISPQRPIFMLPPPIAQPFLMLPQHMTQPRWPINPLQSALPKMPVTDSNFFVPFTALTADTAAVSHAEMKKHLKDGIREKKPNEDLVNFGLDEKEIGQTRYKTEYRKTNQASSMLICDKVKLSHKKAPPSKLMNLVDISDGSSKQSSSTGNDMPIAKLVTSHMIQESLSFNAGRKKSGKGKKKITTSSLTSGAKKKLKKCKTGVSRKEKLDSANQTNQGDLRVRKGKKSDVKKQSAQEKSQRTGDGKQMMMRGKKKTQLTPEKILYNKLTQVVKQIAEPNIFSPITLPPNLVIRCSYCDVIYQDRKTLWDHIQTHLKKPVPFRLSKYYRFCRICRKYVSEIRDHIRAVHCDGGTPYGCPKCSERFRYKGLLRNHIQNRHTTARNYMCEICGLAFKQSVTLRKHTMVHTDEKNFFCSTCGKAFKTMYALQKHVVVHAIVKPFRCEICDKQFTQQTNMKSHMRTHTGEKPYRCDVCTMAFTHNVSLKMHKEKQHGIDMWKDPQHAQTSKLLASSAPNVKMAIKFIDELSSQAERDQASSLDSNEAKGNDG